MITIINGILKKIVQFNYFYKPQAALTSYPKTVDHSAEFGGGGCQRDYMRQLVKFLKKATSLVITIWRISSRTGYSLCLHHSLETAGDKLLILQYFINEV